MDLLLYFQVFKFRASGPDLQTAPDTRYLRPDTRSFPFYFEILQGAEPGVSRGPFAPALLLVEIRSALGTQPPAGLVAYGPDRYPQNKLFQDDRVDFYLLIPVSAEIELILAVGIFIFAGLIRDEDVAEFGPDRLFHLFEAPAAFQDDIGVHADIERHRFPDPDGAAGRAQPLERKLRFRQFRKDSGKPLGVGCKVENRTFFPDLLDLDFQRDLLGPREGPKKLLLLMKMQ